MANQEHLDILKQGVEVWNQWRKEHRDVHPDLSGVDLDGAHFNDARFSFSQFNGDRFSDAQLHRAYFVNSDLSYANCSRSLLTEAHLDRAKLKKTNLSEAKLQHAKVRKGFTPVLLPIHLDQAPHEMRGSWTRLLRLAQHQSRDFTHWNDQNVYQADLKRLLYDLEAEPPMSGA
jgi:hypothetical protein